MKMNVAQKLIASHLDQGTMQPGEEIGLKIDQTLTQDATGTMVMLELEAMGVDQVHTELSAQYVDHNLLQEDYKNPDDHRFLQSACQRFGDLVQQARKRSESPDSPRAVWSTRQDAARVRQSYLLGRSHWHVGHRGRWIGRGHGHGWATVLCQDAENLGRQTHWLVAALGQRKGCHPGNAPAAYGQGRCGTDRGVLRAGLGKFAAMDRHVIANMGAELGATSTVFPSDQAVRRFLKSQAREQDWIELVAD